MEIGDLAIVSPSSHDLKILNLKNVVGLIVEGPEMFGFIYRYRLHWIDTDSKTCLEWFDADELTKLTKE